jgi:two-component system sensor histidine kinase/response regulator
MRFMKCMLKKYLLLITAVVVLSIQVKAQNDVGYLINQFQRVVTSQQDSASYYLHTLEKLRTKDNQSKILNCEAIFVGRWESDYQKALKYIDTALVSAKDSTDYYLALNSKANFFKELGKYPEAVKIYTDYLGYAKRNDKKKLIGKIYSNIGSTYAYANKDVDALPYLKQALIHFKSAKMDLEYYRASMILGSSYIKLDSLQQGAYYLPGAISFFKNTNYYFFYADAMKEYSTVKYNLKQYDSAIYYMNESYKIFENQHTLESLALISLNLSSCYQKIKNIKLAEQYAALGYKYALDNQAPDVIMMATYSNYEFYKDQERIDKALTFFELYEAYKDTFMNAEKESELNALNIKYKTVEKDNELLKNKNDITEKNFLIQKQHTRIYFISALFILTALIVVLVSYLIRKQRKLNKELTELNDFKNKVISIISHDLRNPVAEIASHSNEEDIKNKAVSALNILESLLNWSYPQLNKNRLKPVTIILSEIIEDVREQISYLTDRKHQKVNVSINESFTFTGDYDTTLIIFRNLLTNASKYADDSETIVISQTGNEISIINTCTKTIEAGTGIGIKLCEDLARQNNYKLRIEFNNNIATAYLKV